jgi:lipopolysaccharide transport system ATP-binding protein
MSDAAIIVQNLSKSYLVGHQSARRESYTSLRDVIGREARDFGRKVVDLARGRQIIQGDAVEEFWALKNVTFEVKKGEAVGIIGRNGAGKSTLLKILSRITEPTSGRVVVSGRVASLLEVGTGFHPELTGRENIFLNGAILGMTQREIRKKFDEIVAFAEVDQFLDTPVKRYSSGMYVRLAFAVAAHLEPEILIVDEVLAVGDADFQKKCLGKMNNISRNEGRTVLFVSHNMEALLKFCSRGVLFNSGQLVDSGDVREVVSHHLEKKLSHSNIIDLNHKPRDLQLPNRVRFIEARASSKPGGWSIPFGQHLAFDICVDSQISFVNVELGLGLLSARGFELASWTNKCSDSRIDLHAGLNVIRVEYTDLALLPGQYSVGIGLRSDRGFEDYVPEAVSFEVLVSQRSAQINAQNFGGLMIPTVAISAIQ